MLQWAHANPQTARILLRFAVRLALAVAVVLPLSALGEAYGVSPNIAVFTAVAAALLFGGRLAERVAQRLGLPAP